MAQMRRLSAALGISPAQRCRVTPSPQMDLFDQPDPAERYFEG